MNGLVKETSVQQYPVSDRFLVFQLLTKMFQKYSEELKANRPEFLYGLLQLVEGERDPRCLLVVFRLMHSVIESLDLDPYTEDVFEVISCYFPILFTPTPDDEYGITKEDLSGELHRCFTACPQFAPFLFPLVLEKLESELITAKIDSYKVIEGVSRNYGYERINQFIPQLWTAIRVDVLKPKLLETEISEHALKALISISDAMIENELMFDSFTKQIWTDISNAFNKPELDLVDSGVSIMLATISSNAYAFNQMITQLMPILLKQFTFCQKESTRVDIIESISRILSHSRNISQKQINLINFESLFTLMTSLSVADTETDNIRESVVSCLQQLIQLKQMNDNKWEIITKTTQQK
ncbi:unnamed protein product [Medioppia subpectinata]|uniref:MMS19 nucleotide excision repair protein n=1 Tax=Medioppia subpectinata TaxID=1979941 RepID=A0A7R9KFK4_9ACAR|nr:unnamed protein product [Medioppia subpectinata]CAG2102637.1 unnamed protein product [Medioppia subpectinata]